MTFYPKTWSGEPLVIPIPSVLGKLVTQGALPVALLLALAANRRKLIRPSMYLGLYSLLIIEVAFAALQARHVGTNYRVFRLAGFVATLWLLTPWWGRKDLFLVRCHVQAMAIVLGQVVLGLLVSPSRAMGGGRLGGDFWPTPPTQVAEFAAITMGLVIVLWLCRQVSGRVTLLACALAGFVLIESHTRTALVAMTAGLLIARAERDLGQSPSPQGVRLGDRGCHGGHSHPVELPDHVAGQGRGNPAADRPHRADERLGGGGEHAA